MCRREDFQVGTSRLRTAQPHLQEAMGPLEGVEVSWEVFTLRAS